MQLLLEARLQIGGYIDNLDPGDPELVYFKQLEGKSAKRRTVYAQQGILVMFPKGQLDHFAFPFIGFGVTSSPRHPSLHLEYS